MKRLAVGMVAIAVGVAAVRVVLADEDPDTHAQRLANIAKAEKQGTKPWAIDYSITYDDHRALTQSKPYAHTEKLDVHATGGGRTTFFVEPDATPGTFRHDPHGALWKDNSGRGAYSETADASTTVPPPAGCGTQTWHQSKTAPGMTCEASFEIDDAQQIWMLTVGCDAPDTPTVTDQDVALPSPRCATRRDHASVREQLHFDAACTHDTPGAKLARDKDGYTVDCTLVTPHAPDSDAERKISGDRKAVVHARIDFKPRLDYYATLEPANDKDYQAWIPEGPRLDGGSVKDKDGNALAVQLVLRDATTKQPVAKAYDATVTLASSRIPGVAMNYPPLADSDNAYDLYFAKAANHDGAPAGKDAQMLVIGKRTGPAALAITARDYGAFGTLAAVVNVDGKPVPVRAVALGKETDTLAIPRDDDRNHIADQWEEDANILGKAYPPTWDEEAEPALFTPGDGYSLYDEYRGFYLQPGTTEDGGPANGKGTPAKHLRLSPRKRELLVGVDGKRPELGYAGAVGYSLATSTGGGPRVLVHFVPTPAYAAPLTKAEPDPKHPRLANFNRSEPDKLDEPAALLWVVLDDTVGAAKTDTSATADTPTSVATPNGALAYMSPAYTTGVHVHLRNCADEARGEIGWAMGPKDPKYGLPKADRMMAALAARNLTYAAFKAAAVARTPQAADDLAEFTVIHEMGHATGAQHHEIVPYLECKHGCSSEADCGSCDPFTATSRRSMKCSVADVPGTAQELSAKDTEPFLKDLTFQRAHGWNCYAGEPEHFDSGDHDCPMRYWHFLDGAAVVKWELGEWHPSQSGPTGAWHFCAKENLPTMRLRQRADQLFAPVQPAPTR